MAIMVTSISWRDRPFAEVKLIVYRIKTPEEIQFTIGSKTPPATQAEGSAKVPPKGKRLSYLFVPRAYALG